jgi:hypothetical protein
LPRQRLFAGLAHASSLASVFPPHLRSMNDMSDFTFGLTMIVVGMGGTLLTLWLLVLFITGLKKLFPPAEAADDHKS